MGKKRTKSGGQSSAYNTIVLLDIEELWSHNVRVRQCCSGTVCTNTDKFLAGLSCTLLTAGKNHTKSRRRYYANNQLTIQNYYIPFHTIATLHLTKKKYSN